MNEDLLNNYDDKNMPKFNRVEVSAGINEILNYAVENGILDELAELRTIKTNSKWERNLEMVKIYYSTNSDFIELKKTFGIKLNSVKAHIRNVLSLIVEQISHSDTSKYEEFKGYLEQGDSYIFKTNRIVNRKHRGHNNMNYKDLEEMVEVVSNFHNQLVNPRFILENLNQSRSEYNRLRLQKQYNILPEVYTIKEWLVLCLSQTTSIDKHLEVLDFLSKGQEIEHYQYLRSEKLLIPISRLGIRIARGEGNSDKRVEFLRSKNIPVGVMKKRGNSEYTYKFIPTKFTNKAIEHLKMYYKKSGNLEEQ